MDSIFKEVAVESLSKSEVEKLTNKNQIVLFDSDKEIKLSKLPFFRFNRSIRAFIIDFENDVELKDIEVTVRDFEKDASVQLVVSVNISLIKDYIDRTILSLTEDLSPTQEVKSKIERWVKSFAKKQDNFIGNYSNLKGELNRYLSDESERTLGLDLIPRIKVKGLNNIKDEIYRNESVRVYVKDSSEEIILKFKAVILPVDKDDDNYIYTALSKDRTSERKEIISKTISSHFIKYKYQYIIEHLDSELVQDIIKDCNSKLEKHGRELNKLNIELDYMPHTKPIEHVCKIPYNGTKFPKSIEFEAKVKLTLKDIGLFEKEKKKRSIELINTWVEDTLKDLITTHMFYATYIDLVKEFSVENLSQYEDAQIIDENSSTGPTKDNYCKHIISDFKKEALSIGYEVLVLIVEPKLPELEYAKDGFSIESETLEFSTKTPDISLNVQYFITGRIADLKKIENLINENIDIKDRVDRQAKKILSEIIHEKYPNEAMLNFNESVEIPVQGRLEGVLIENFAIDPFSLSIIVKQADNSLLKRYKELSSSTREVEVKVIPKYDGAKHEEFNYKFLYKIIDVHPDYWYTFQKNIIKSVQEELKEVEKIFTEAVRSIMEVRPGNNASALKNGMEKVKRATGLILEPFTYRADETVSGKVGRELYKAKIGIRKTKEIESFKDKLDIKNSQKKILETKLLALLNDEDSDQDEIDTLRSRIKELDDDTELPFNTEPLQDFLPSSEDVDIQGLLNEVRESKNNRLSSGEKE